MKDDLLWVYEGLTEYLGEVLTARSGLWNMQQSREDLARIATEIGAKPGPRMAPSAGYGRRRFVSLQRGHGLGELAPGLDFYEEGELLWLDVDTTLRRLTDDKKSMDDFCRIFYGGPGGEPALKTYTFDDVVSTLNGLAPYRLGGLSADAARFGGARYAR